MRAPKGAGSAKHQSGYALYGVLLHHIFAVAGTLARSFIATAKTSHTIRTLSASCPNLVGNM